MLRNSLIPFSTPARFLVARRLLAQLRSAFLLIAMLSFIGLGAACDPTQVPETVSTDITPSGATLKAGYSLQLRATATLENGSVHDVTESLAWGADPAASSGGALVSDTGLVTGVVGGTVVVNAWVNEPSGVLFDSVDVNVIELSFIVVTPALATTTVGSMVEYTATGHYSDGTTEDISSLVQWWGDDSIVWFDEAHRAHAIAEGESIIAASDPITGVWAYTHLTVVEDTEADLVGLDVSPEEVTIGYGGATYVTATGTFSDGTVRDISDSVTWSSSDPDVVSVAYAGFGARATAGDAFGVFTIEALDAETGLTDSMTLTVTEEPAIILIFISPSGVSLPLGSYQLFTATALYSDGSVEDVSSTVTWASTDMDIVTVANGVQDHGSAHAVGRGDAYVTAYHPDTGVIGFASVEVTPAVLAGIVLDPQNPSAFPDDVVSFTATAYNTDLTIADIPLDWDSSDGSVATIDEDGNATAASVGTTTIFATDPVTGISGQTTLTVEEVRLTSIVISPANASIEIDQTLQYAAEGHYNDGSVADFTTEVTWDVQSDIIAEISNEPGTEGLATAKGVGSTFIAAFVDITDPALPFAFTTLEVTPSSE